MPDTVSLYDFTPLALDGSPYPLSRHRGEVLLIVNTASRCGFTPQYAELEALFERYRAQGFCVLAFPCNQFGEQEPGDSSEIGAFCQRNYGVSFPVMAKVDVNGAEADPVWRYLTQEKPGLLGLPAIKWNFTKFLVGRDGHVVERYAPQTRPAKLAADIERLL